MLLCIDNPGFEGSGSIEKFYYESITLTEATVNGSGAITGRFIGSGAKGAISVYQLDYENEHKLGTAVFER